MNWFHFFHFSPLLLLLLHPLLLENVFAYSPPCIPVMGFGYLQDPMGFIPRLLSSIDHCVEKFVVIGSDHHQVELKQFIKLHENLTYLSQKHQLIGVSEGWNLILKTYSNAPWFLITAYDVEFLPGQLAELSQRFWKESRSGIQDYERGNQEVQTNFAHTKWQNLPGGRGFNLFAISQDVIQNVGYFDENIFPAFWEDRDYQYRMKLWTGSRIQTYRTIRPWHGEHPHTPSLSNSNSNSLKKFTFNYTSGTVYLGKEWLKIMKISSQWNLKYVTEKWGCDLSSAIAVHHLINCSYTTPFNQQGVSIASWTLHWERIQKMKLEYDHLMAKSQPK